MAESSKARAAVKFCFWTLAAAVLIFIVARAYTNGQMAAWFYYEAKVDGYAVNARSIMHATKQAPAVLKVGPFAYVDGERAVPVRKGDRLPASATGVIGADVVKRGRRARLEADTLVVTVPWQIAEKSGFKFKDTFQHKGIETYAWGAVWNVLMTLGLGLTLGYMAEGFTDLLGIKLEKIRHFEGH
jgi:hypothetical protein